jgi:hypothetical protein
MDADRGCADPGLIERARAVMNDAWHGTPGFCVPNRTVYPHQWLWDSCFHAVVWSSWSDARALVELGSALAHQDPATGFVPHMTYWTEPERHRAFWKRSMVSTITQPPMFGHAIAQAHRAGLRLDPDTLVRAERGLFHLLGRPRVEGLVCVFHPWETGCDDSARWDDWCPDGFDPQRWWMVKGELVSALVFDDAGTPIASTLFEVPSVGFNALLAWNIEELVSVGVGETSLAPHLEPLRAAIARRWHRGLRTWTDADSGSGTARTLDAVLAALVDPRDEAFDDLVDPGAYGARFGPCGAHRDEPTFHADRYWRGPSWPQLTYLLAVAARRVGRHDVADGLAGSLRAAAARNGFAEYWNPDTAEPGGATPQTWTALAAVPL